MSSKQENPINQNSIQDSELEPANLEGFNRLPEELKVRLQQYFEESQNYYLSSLGLETAQPPDLNKTIALEAELTQVHVDLLRGITMISIGKALKTYTGIIEERLRRLEQG